MNPEEMLRRTMAKIIDEEIAPIADDLDEKETFLRERQRRRPLRAPFSFARTPIKSR